MERSDGNGVHDSAPQHNGDNTTRFPSPENASAPGAGSGGNAHGNPWSHHNATQAGGNQPPQGLGNQSGFSASQQPGAVNTSGMQPGQFGGGFSNSSPNHANPGFGPQAAGGQGFGAPQSAGQGASTQSFAAQGFGGQGYGATGPSVHAPGAPNPAPQKKGMSKGAMAALLVGAMLISGGIGGVVGASVSGPSSVLGGAAGIVPDSKPTDGTVESVAEKVVPSVVSITAAGRSQGGEGSGVVLSADGMILTNAHVANAGGRNGQLQVTFSDGTVADAELVGDDPGSDIAVIRADRQDLTPIQVGTSDNLLVGQDVVAIGSPLGLSGTVTTGIVSALDRPVMAGGENSDQSTVLDAIQTDAAINPGNSGGALVDMGGNLVGINSAIASLGSSGEGGSIGLGFAIPVDQAMRIANQLINQGYATRAVFGATVSSDPRIVGAQLAGVERGGAADQAGIPEDAVITKLNDRVIDSGDELVAAVRSQAPGDTVTVTYRDGNEEKTAQVTLDEAR